MANTANGVANTQYVPVDAVFSGDCGSLAASVGDRLKQARVKAGWSLAAAATATRIKPDYLEALESMDSRGLPSRAYAIGYLRTYAAFLGLDVASVVEQFKHEVECEAGRAQPTAPKTKREIRLPRGVVGAVLILGGVIGAASWYGAQVSSQTGAFADVSAPGERAAIEAPLVAPGDAPPSIVDIWSGLPRSSGGEGLILRASAPTFVEVRDASGRILFSRDLRPGEVYRAPDEPGLTVSTENAGAVRAWTGQTELGPLGEEGEVVENLAAGDFVAEAVAALTEAAPREG